MEHLSESFGRLSTSAREWTPQYTSSLPRERSASERSSSIDSELNAASVKEFVPGQGWSTSTSTDTTAATGTTDSYYEDEHQHHEGGGDDGSSIPAILPAGPTCPSTFRSLHSLGMSDDLWQFYRDASLQTLRQMDPSDPRHKAVPLPYVNAYCIQEARSQTFGFACQTFQVVNRTDGFMYCLRRFDNVPKNLVNPRLASQILEQWLTVEHPNLVPLQNCFMAHRAVFFVHAWIPNACSLREYFGSQHQQQHQLNERYLWSALCQIVAVLRRLHASNSNSSSSSRQQQFSVSKCLNLRHVLIQTNMTKVSFFINSCGIADALYESNHNKAHNNNNNNINSTNSGSLEESQTSDIRQLGRFILGMAAGGTELTAQTDAATIQNCERYCLQTYSREFHNLAMTLIRSPTPPSIVDISRALAGRVWDEWDHVQLTLHRTERALSAEYESGRALRLLLKMGFINERPEFGPNRRWQQSGDCYVLTLFRDYVFHQADGAGNPVMDLGHVITALNKLDAADEERIVLSSRDGKSLMVVSYADVARCLDSAYHELCAGSVPPPSVHHPQPY